MAHCVLSFVNLPFEAIQTHSLDNDRLFESIKLQE